MTEVKKDILTEFNRWLKIYHDSSELTRKRYIGAVGRALERGQSWEDIDVEAIIEEQERLKYKTKNVERNALNKFMLFTQEKYGFNHNKKFKILRAKDPDKNKVSYLTMEELKKFEAAIAGFSPRKQFRRNILIFTLLLEGGLRISELLKLDVKDVVDSTGQVREQILIKGKGNKARYIVVQEKMAKRLKEYIETERGEGYLFAGSYTGRPMSQAAISVMLKGVGGHAGIDVNRITPHKFRHSFAVHSLSAGVSLNSVQQALGHSEIKTTAMYLYISDEERFRQQKEKNPFKVLEGIV